MLISLDTNAWIFSIIAADAYCETILDNLHKFKVVVPDQVRVELERNLSNFGMRRFYQEVSRFDIDVDYTLVPKPYIALFEAKGLKKGDAEIGAYCEWRCVDIIVSYNRDFLRGLSPEHYFEVVSPEQFCESFEL